MASLSADSVRQALLLEPAYLARINDQGGRNALLVKQCYYDQEIALIDMVVDRIQDKEGFITQNYSLAVEEIRLRGPNWFPAGTFTPTMGVHEDLKRLLRLLREKRANFVRERSQLPEV